ncbi:Polygalacturonase 1 [Teratosphaeriaceae sp. CCFEE 6253]|nr:Polygalacturonase 1 [Teratosphaeriaceae sp. CCFEE 6253]
MLRSLTSLTLALALCGTAVVANPVPAPQVTAAQAVQDLEKRAGSCTFSGSAGAASASKSKASCATIVLSSVAVPSGTTLDLTGLTSGTHVSRSVFEGTTTFGYKEWAGPLISVSGTNIVVTGASGSLLDGGGSRWWDGVGTNGGKTKPKFFYAHNLLGTSSITGINIKNSPVQVFSVNGAKGLTITNANIDNTAGDSGGGHNTDCFDVGSSSNVVISGAVCKNQDVSRAPPAPNPCVLLTYIKDCLAINSGTDITFTGGTCSGGHGLSIGSVGGRDDNTVDTVLIENSKITNSQNGVRVKTVYGATGSVEGVTYKGIVLSGITKYGIVIEQDYENGSPTGTPTSGVPITGLTVSGVTGSVASSATDVYILCASCSGWTWSGNSVTGGKVSTSCKGLPSGVTCSGK